MNISNFFLCLILATCAYFLYSWFNSCKIDNIQKLVQKSNGTFDLPAQNALQEYQHLQNPSPQDSFVRSRIIELNQHEGRVENVADFDDIVDAYTTLLNDDLDWWEMEQIEHFAERHHDIINANPIYYNNFITELEQERPRKLEQQVQDSINETCTKKEAVNVFVDNSITNTSDSQNVHDSAVNKQLRDHYSQLLDSTPITLSNSAIEDEIIQQINKSNPKNIKAALNSLDIIKKNTSFTPIKDPEMELLKVVWERSKLNENILNSNLLKDAVIDSLVDMSTSTDRLGSDIVCSSGRCTRLLGSLVLLDHDPTLSNGFFTVEQIRNDVLQNSKQILQDTIEEYSDDIDEKMKTVAESYKSEIFMETDPVTEDIFKNIVIQKIENSLENNYKEKLPEKDYNNIKEQCIAAIKY
jgi:hypothetical protein